MSQSESLQLKIKMDEQCSRERRHIALAVHEYLRDVLGESDEPDIAPASVLKDLFDCRVCVQHIAQVYLKGIMEPVSATEFGLRSRISDDELQVIIKRTLDKSLRCPPSEISYDDSVPPLIIDVGARYEFADSVPANGAVNIPLTEYALNPHLAGDNKFRKIIFQSRRLEDALTAKDLAEGAGYRCVQVW